MLRTLKPNTQPRALTYTFGGSNASGATPGYADIIENVLVTLNTTGGHTPAQVATAWGAAVDAALGSDFTITVASNVVTVSANSREHIVTGGHIVTFDANATCTVTGNIVSQRFLSNQSVKATGRPSSYSSGLSVWDGDPADAIDPDVANAQVVLHAVGTNKTGSDATAWFRLWILGPFGWFKDEEIGDQLLTIPGASPYTISTALQVYVPGQRVAVELVGADEAGTTNLTSGVLFSAYLGAC